MRGCFGDLQHCPQPPILLIQLNETEFNLMLSMSFAPVSFTLILVSQALADLPCLDQFSSWTLQPLSYAQPRARVSWEDAPPNCTSSLLVSVRATGSSSEEIISRPIQVKKGSTSVTLPHRCGLYSVRLATISASHQVEYSPAKLVWPPSLLITVSLLSHLLVLSSPPDCPAPPLTLSACPSSRLETCAESPLASHTETYLTGLSPCTQYTVSLSPPSQMHLAVWSEERVSPVNLQLAVSLQSNSGLITTFYDTKCSIAPAVWSVSYCSSPVVGRDPEVGISFDDNDRDNVEDVEEEKSDIGPRDYIGPVVENREELGDDSDYGGSGDHESQDDCRSIQIHPDQVQVTARIEGLKPCTQYTFRMGSRHQYGEEERVITEHTFCGSSPSSSPSPPSPPPSPSSPPLLLFLLLLLTALSLAAIIVVRGALALQHRVVVRKPQRSELANLL